MFQTPEFLPKLTETLLNENVTQLYYSTQRELTLYILSTLIHSLTSRNVKPKSINIVMCGKVELQVIANLMDKFEGFEVQK